MTPWKQLRMEQREARRERPQCKPNTLLQRIAVYAVEVGVPHGELKQLSRREGVNYCSLYNSIWRLRAALQKHKRRIKRDASEPGNNQVTDAKRSV